MPTTQIEQDVSGLSENSSDFIIDTQITWTMVEKDMQKALNTEAKFGENKKAELIGQGNGYISKVVVAKLNWSEPQNQLPQSVVLKITESDKEADNEEKDDSGRAYMHNNELAFYRLVNEDWKIDHKEFKLPSYFCGRECSDIDGYIALEHVTNSVVRPMYRRLHTSGAVACLRAIAKLHALFYKHQDSLKKFETDNFFEMSEDCCKEENVRSALKYELEQFPECEEQIKLLTKKEHIFSLENYKKLIADSSHLPVLCHGDLWPTNILWGSEQETENLSALLDWQTVHMGSPLEDIVYFLATSTTREMKAKDLPLYLDEYYNAFVEQCGKDVQIPFTRQDLLDNYEKFVPYIAVPLIPYFLPYVDSIIDGAQDVSTAREIFNKRMHDLICETAECVTKWY